MKDQKLRHPKKVEDLFSDVEGWVCAINDIARFQSELAVGDYNFVRVGTPPSAIGLAAVMNALDVILLDDLERLNINLPEELELIARCVKLSPGHSSSLKDNFLHRVQLISFLDPESRFVSDARARLWEKIGGNKRCQSTDAQYSVLKKRVFCGQNCGNTTKTESKLIADAKFLTRQQELSWDRNFPGEMRVQFCPSTSPKRKLCRTVSETSSLDARGSPTCP